MPTCNRKPKSWIPSTAEYQTSLELIPTTQSIRPAATAPESVLKQAPLLPAAMGLSKEASRLPDPAVKWEQNLLKMLAKLLGKNYNT